MQEPNPSPLPQVNPVEPTLALPMIQPPGPGKPFDFSEFLEPDAPIISLLLGMDRANIHTLSLDQIEALIPLARGCSHQPATLSGTLANDSQRIKRTTKKQKLMDFVNDDDDD